MERLENHTSIRNGNLRSSSLMNYRIISLFKRPNVNVNICCECQKFFRTDFILAFNPSLVDQSVQVLIYYMYYDKKKVMSRTFHVETKNNGPKLMIKLNDAMIHSNNSYFIFIF